MPPRPTKHIQVRMGRRVRIGPISIITLVVVICMAVMGALALSTSAASQAIASRQAEATDNLYANERAGQEFVSGVDNALEVVRSSGGGVSAGARAVKQELGTICERAREAARDQVECTADVDGTTVNAEFICENARVLDITITIRNDATYRIDRWEMTSVQQERDSSGALWSG